MAKRRKKSSKGKSTTVNWKGVKKGGRRKIKAGDYPFKCTKCYEEESEKSGNPTVYFEMEITSGKNKGWVGFVNCSLTKKALWKLRATLEALGFDIEEDSKQKFRWKDMKGLTCAGTVDEETWEGKTRSKLLEVFPLSELDEDDDEEEDEDEEKEEGDDDEEDDDEEEDEDEEEEDD